MSSNLKLADRVYQLEASSLDNEFNKMIDSILDGLDIPIVTEETKLLLKLYIFAMQMLQFSTSGMRVYNLRLCSPGSINNKPHLVEPERYKLILLAAHDFLVPYLSRRYEYIRRHIDISLTDKLKLRWLNMENFEMLMKLLNLVNFLAFLNNGKYLGFSNRLLGIVLGVSDESYYMNIATNQVQMELIGRDLIWKSLAELLAAFIPYINTIKLRNSFLRILTPLSGETAGDKNLRRLSQQCAICQKQPFNPFLIGCKHVFCYYCLHSSYLADTSVGYTCPSCKYSTKDPSLVHRYKIAMINK